MFLKHYQFHSFRFTLSTPLRELQSELDLLYPACATGPCDCPIAWSLHRTSTNGSISYMVCQNGHPVVFTRTPGQLMEELEWIITLKILSNMKHFLQVHAAGLVRDGKALLLVGPSGSGKTTLTVQLLGRGWQCLSDDVIFINPENGMAWPFPRGFHVDGNTERLILGRYRNNRSTSMDASGKRRFDPSVIRKDWIAGPAEPRWLVFLQNGQHDPNIGYGKNKLTPAGETLSLSLLVGQTINCLDHEDNGLGILARLVRHCESFQFHAVNLSCVDELIANLTGGEVKAHSSSNKKY